MLPRTKGRKTEHYSATFDNWIKQEGLTKFNADHNCGVVLPVRAYGVNLHKYKCWDTLTHRRNGVTVHLDL